MCFGPTSAPRTWTKLVSAYLRTMNIRLAVYLDDWLNLNQIKQSLIQDKTQCLYLLVSLGFMINLEKSNLNLNKKLVYLGALFNFKLALVFHTEERFMKIQQAILPFHQKFVKAHDFLHLLGQMASCIEQVPHARLFMRLIQLHLLCFWKPSKIMSIK